MAIFTTEKTSSLYGQLPGNSSSQPREIESRHRFKKTFAFFGLILLVLWLFRAGCWVSPPRDIMKVDSRKRQIDTGAQSLDGQFDLFDLFSIRSTSGSINVNIHPQPADEETPLPAELLIDSQSGLVSVDFPAFNAPERDYQVSIETRSASINGHILHGQTTSINSKSGSIGMHITPYAADKYASSLRTSTQSSSQHISLLSPATEPGISISRMSSSHSASSGSLTLRYPKEWEGTIEGTTESGGLTLHGGNLDIIRQDSIKSSGHYVLARKGNGNSTLNFHTESGSIDVYFN